jgi:phosphoglycerate dehydrogenase-like enzyme
MTLNVLWRSSNSSTDIKTYTFPRHLNIKLETDANKALEHLEWLNVLVDGNAPEALLDAPNLKHVIIPFVGLDPEFRSKLLHRPHLKVYNSHYNDAFVAQHALALVLACAARLIEADQLLRRGDWRNRYDRLESMFLPGKTCLLLGYGAIGKALEPLLRALGMKVIAVKRIKDKGESIPVYDVSELHPALQLADVVVCSLPGTPETDHVLDKHAFAAMKQGSILVNVGRGNVIDQYALYNALKSKHLLAAGLDVWWNYPKTKEERDVTLPATAPLHELPNIIMSPHRANQVENEERVRLEDVVKTLEVIAQGKERNRIDVERGY